jgi:AAA domain
MDFEDVIAGAMKDVDEELAAKFSNGLTCWKQPFDVRAYTEGERTRVKPSLLMREDGSALLYEGRVNEFHGEPEAGKGFIAGVAVAEALLREDPVVYLDFDQDPEGTTERVLAGGARPEYLVNLKIHSIDEPLPMVKSFSGIRHFTDEATGILDGLTHGAALVVVDGVNTAMSMHGMKSRDDSDYSDFARLFGFRFRRAGSTVLLLDHLPKGTDKNDRYAFGTARS